MVGFDMEQSSVGVGPDFMGLVHLSVAEVLDLVRPRPLRLHAWKALAASPERGQPQQAEMNRQAVTDADARTLLTFRFPFASFARTRWSTIASDPATFRCLEARLEAAGDAEMIHQASDSPPDGADADSKLMGNCFVGESRRQQREDDLPFLRHRPLSPDLSPPPLRRRAAERGPGTPRRGSRGHRGGRTGGP